VHNANTTDCQTAPFDFHPMYATATTDHVLTWGANNSNVSFTTEFGHWELCGNASCSILPDGDGDDTVGCTTVRGIGGCTGGSPGDTDFDGLGYQPNWPDGTSSHPGSIFIGASNSKGVGPLSASPADATKYTQGYGDIKLVTNNANTTNFYPFFA